METQQDNSKLYWFLRLIRWENLVIIFATQYLFGKYVINALFNVPDQVFQKFYQEQGLQGAPFHFGLKLSDLNFFLLCLSTVLIAAAGYIINDYFDVKTDRINRPSSLIIDKRIKRRVAMLLHVLFNFLGIALGVYLAIVCGNIQLAAIQLLSASLLWFYSTNFKKMFFLGNFIVALLVAVVPLTVVVFNQSALEKACTDAFVNDPVYFRFITMFNVDTRRPLDFAIVFSLFAFLINFQREIVKDMEDFIGDLETGGETIPIRMGHKFAKSVVHVLNGFTILIAVYASVKFLIPNKDFVWYKLGVSGATNSNIDGLSFVYFLIFIVLPLLVFIFYLNRSNSPQSYRRAGYILKFVMLSGVLYSFVIWYNFTQAI